MGGFFKSKQQKALERESKLREGKVRIKRLIEKQRVMSKRLWDLAKRALALDDQNQFKQLGKRYLITLQDVRRKERYLLTLESLEAQLDQSRTSVEFMEALKGLTGTITDLAGPQNIAAMQREVESGLARAETLSDKLDVLMELATDSVYTADAELSDDKLKELEAAMNGDAAPDHGQASPYDARIEEALKKIAEEMKRAN